MKQVYEPFRGSGKLYLRKYGAAAALAEIGNCNAVKFAVELDSQEIPDYTSPAGGTYASDDRIKSGTVSFNAWDFNTDNLTRAMAGTSTNVPTPTAAGGTYTAFVGGLIMLDGLNPQGVTVVDHATPATEYVKDVDYEVRPEGIYILDGAIADGTDIDITPTSFSAHDVIEAMTTSGDEYELVFAGINSTNGRAQRVQAFKVKFSPADVDLISDGFGSIPFTAKLLKDTTVTGTGVSQYYKNLKEAAA